MAPPGRSHGALPARNGATVTVPRDALAAAPPALRDAITRHARYSVAQPWEDLSSRQRFQCLGLAVRDLMVDGLLHTQQR